MKPLGLLAGCLLLFVACKKEAYNQPAQNLSTAWGQLEACIITDSVFGNREAATAVFYNSEGQPISVGAVRVNDKALVQSPGAAPVYKIENNNLSLGSRLAWRADGKDAVPGFSFNANKSFPSCNYTLPDSLPRSSTGFSLTADSVQFAGADSVLIQLDAGTVHLNKTLSVAALQSWTAPAGILAGITADYGFLQITARKYQPALLGNNHMVFVASRRLVLYFGIYD